MGLQIEDIAQLLQIAAGVVSHPALTHGTVKGAQAQIKAFIADKEALQDPDILTPLDKILKYGGAAQVPGAFVFPPFDPKDYADPDSPAAQPEQLPPEEPREEFIEDEPEPVAVQEGGPENGSLSEESNG